MKAVDFELAVERYVNAAPEVVYGVWTARLAEWWCPLPWTATLVEMDLRAGGRLALVMHGPAGERHEHDSVILEVVPNRRIVFTDAFTAGWVPHAPFMVGVFEFHPDGGGTRYRASARHWDADTQRQHEQMGFATGWEKVAEQLAALAEARP